MFVSAHARTRMFDAVPFAARVNPEYSVLSNFAVTESPLEYGGVLYPSVEHAYVHLVRFGGKHTKLFEVGGVLSSFDTFYRWWNALPRKLFAEKHLPKRGSWVGMDGIIAKMVASATTTFGRNVRKVLGMGPPSQDKYKSTDNVLWYKLHEAKARASPKFVRVLQRSRSAYLYEFDKGHARTKEHNSPWGAYCNKTTGKFRGRNVMGRILMRTRRRMFGTWYL